MHDSRSVFASSSTLTLFLFFPLCRVESVTIIRNFGVQLRQVRFSGSESVRFLDKDSIQQVIINDGVLWYGAIYYLAFVVRGHDRLTLAYTHLRPRLPVILRVYRSAQTLVAATAQ